MSPLGWMFIGYSVIWVGLMVFLLNMNRRQEVLERQLREMERAAGRRSGS